MTFAKSSTKITLSQEDIARAVEFWLNEKVLKLPCVVTGMTETRINKWSAFEVELLEIVEAEV